MAAASLLALAACQGGTTASPSHKSPAPAPPTVTITSGNLTFSSAHQENAHKRGAPATSVGDVAAKARAGGGNASSHNQGPQVDQRPDLGVTVRATGGALKAVTLKDSAGAAVPGSLGAAKDTWSTRWALHPSTTYTVTATAVSGKGKKTVTTGEFRTLTPRKTFSAAVQIGAGQEVGVGMPIIVKFNHKITNKAEVARSLQVAASKPITGAWYWTSSKSVWFRTKNYWPAHTKVRLDAHLTGVEGAPGMYGVANLTQHFSVGNSLIAVASTKTHHMKVYWKGKLKGDWPISTGKPGDDTPNGRYLSFSMGNPVDMDSATFGVMPGDPGYYNVMVYDSVKFTYSGDYVHSAPWSVGQQGIVNVSHGCVNVGPSNASWYYHHSLIGDPITVVGSPLAGTFGDGWTIWFLNWRKLLAGTANGKAVAVTSSGSSFIPASLTMPHQNPLRRRTPAGA